VRSFRLALFVTLAAAAARAQPAPPPHQVSPLVISPSAKEPPPADVTVHVAGDEDRLHAGDVLIWPAAARMAGIGGKVVLTCKVDVHGLAETCRVAYEAPQGKGFGEAALALRPTFKLPPRQGPNGPVEANMNIAVEFTPPALDSNLGEVERAQPAPMGTMTGDPHQDRAMISGGSLRITHNPIAMRGVTMMTDPAWVRAPDFGQWAAAYPAKGGGAEGYAVAHCRVQPTGRLTHCVTAKETPARHGFGPAAVALASQFVASSEALAAAPRGAPVEVDVPVRFVPPAQAGPRIVRAPVWLAGADPLTLVRESGLEPADGSRKPGPVLGCGVRADGYLTDCQLELTSPNGIDFDEAALKLAGRMRMSLWSADALPVSGAAVHLAFGPELAEQAR
jgi:TonB family protein